MSQCLDVFVCDERGAPVADTQVTIVINGIFSGGSLESRTGVNGHAQFETAGDYDGTRELRIYVNGQDFGPYFLIVGRYTVQVS